MERIVQEFISKPNLGFEFSREQKGDTAVFHCHGAFSLGSYPDLNVLARKIRETKEKKIVLDMLDVAHIDSAGIGTLATVFKDARAKHRDLRIVPSAAVREGLTMVKINKLLRLYDSLESALN